MFMKGLTIANNSDKIKKIYESPVKTEGEYLDEIRTRLGQFKRSVRHVFGYRKTLVYYQYWTPTQWAEAISCHHSHQNISTLIPLRNPKDFQKVPSDAVSAFHKALQGDEVTERLIDRIRDQTARRILHD